MRLLVLGGTVFLGRHVVDAALERGDDVTVFHRGRHGAELWPGAVEHVLGDRSTNLDRLARRTWEAVVDTSCMRAPDAEAAARALAGATARYVFVSTFNVYRDWPAQPVDESSRVWDSPDDDYGPQKAASERALEAALPGRVANVRAGLLCGPYDNIMRLPWWLQRIARGGDVVAPGPPERALQAVDARDVAGLCLALAAGADGGAFNATAPAGTQDFRMLLDAMLAVTGADARVHWLDDRTLVAGGVEPWTELPLWLAQDDGAGTFGVDTARAQAAGLRCRPLAETVADTWRWLCDGGERSDWLADRRPRGLSAERERELLALAGRDSA